MVYKRFTILVVFRVLLLATTIFVMAWIFGNEKLFFNQLVLALIFVLQIFELIHFVNHTNRELSKLFESIRHSDFSISFQQKAPAGRSFKELQNSFAEIIKAYRQVKIEKEAQYQFLQMLVSQLQVGIISIQHEDIVLINPTAERLLDIAGTKNWKLALQLNPKLAKEFEQLGDRGRKLIELKTSGETRILSVDVGTSVILDRPYKLITIQDINSEIEQKEFDAWHKLIRILTHEIMNSVTPIASLTETMQGMLANKSGESLTDETTADIRFSLNTIHKRSEGLLEFVENYRKLTKVPKPSTRLVNLKTFIADLKNLMEPELARQGVRFNTDVQQETLQGSFDPKLIEQVLINLITNSTHALEGLREKKISLKAYSEGDHKIVLEVTDNGKGIAEKEMKEIFVPFFSTKKDGSGIGLSLSKQIMSLHGGTIRAESKPGEGASFYLLFRS
ncbi:MAG: sensor histidine kinase [Bacteroidota bacterium]